MSDTSSTNMMNRVNYDLSKVKMPIEAEKIMLILPQRYPMLLVDKVIKLSAGELVAIKAVTIGEQCLVGHFPDEPVFPGVYTLEACAQAATLLGYYNYCHPIDVKKFQLAVRIVAVDSVRFKKEIIPGDVIEITVSHLGTKVVGESVFHRFRTVGRVAGRVVVEATMMGYFFNRLDRVVSIVD